MREDVRGYSSAAYDFVGEISESIGARLPGSKEEKKFAGIMRDKLAAIGVAPKTEKFAVAPRASIGGIPYIGWAGLLACLLVCFPETAFIAFAICAACWIFLVVQVVLYKGWFDDMFPQEMSQNVYGELLPEDGKYEYTVMLSAHMDSSWNWTMSARNPKTMVLKMVWGVLGMLILTAGSLALFVLYAMSMAGELTSRQLMAVSDFAFAMRVIPVFCAPGCCFITMWCSKHKGVASPGAMDNMTGIAINYQIMKYFSEHRDALPAGCRLIDMNFGSEEAGLKGSEAFVKLHKNDGMLKDMYNINVDSIADKDFFEVINGDAWQFTKFDKELEDMMFDAMREAGIAKPGRMKNPVGGCDSTPLVRAGVKTITFAAQNPVATEYYHTYMDVAERFDADTVHKGMEIVLGTIDRIAASRK